MMEEEEGNAKARKRTIDDLDVSFSGEDDEDTANDEIHSSSSVDGVYDGEYSFITSVGNRIDKCREVMTCKDGNGCNHSLCKFPVIQTGEKMKKRSKVQNCSICSKETTFFCFQCQKAYCYSFSDKGHGRKCFMDHVPSRTSSRLSG